MQLLNISYSDKFQIIVPMSRIIAGIYKVSMYKENLMKHIIKNREYTRSVYGQILFYFINAAE